MIVILKMDLLANHRLKQFKTKANAKLLNVPYLSLK